EFRLNSTTAGDQQAPRLAALEGGFVAVWDSFGQDGDKDAIVARRFDSEGVSLGNETLINETTASWQVSPDVTGTPDGGYAVAWQSEGQDDSFAGVYARRFANDDAPVGGEFQLNVETDNYQSYPRIATLADGRLTAVWESEGQDGDGDGIFARIFSLDGTPEGIEFQVNEYFPSYQSRPDITMLTDGGFAVAWTSYGQDGDRNGVYTRAFNADGTPAGNETQVARNTRDNQEGASVAGLSDGTYLVGFTDAGSSFGLEHGYVARFNADGSAQGVPIITAGTLSTDAYWSGDVAATKGGSVLAAGNITSDGDNQIEVSALTVKLNSQLVVNDAEIASAESLLFFTEIASDTSNAAAVFENNNAHTLTTVSATESLNQSERRQKLSEFAKKQKESIGDGEGKISDAQAFVNIVNEAARLVVSQSNPANEMIQDLREVLVGKGNQFTSYFNRDPGQNTVSFGSTGFKDEFLKREDGTIDVGPQVAHAMGGLGLAYEYNGYLNQLLLFQETEQQDDKLFEAMFKLAKELNNKNYTELAKNIAETIGDNLIIPEKPEAAGETVNPPTDIEKKRADFEQLKELIRENTDIFETVSDELEITAAEFFKELARKTIDTVRDLISGSAEHARELFDGANRPIDPIVLDLDRDGIELINVAASNARFDMDADGFAERTGWVAPDDAFLIYDRNGDGVVNDISEFFGSSGIDGFAELEGFDTNRDGVIAPDEPIWEQLKLWRDLNGDGNTDLGELTTLDAAGINQISVRTTEVRYSVEGNLIPYITTFNDAEGEGLAGDVFFQVNQFDSAFSGSSTFAEDFTLDPEALLLPFLRGYGNVPDLYIEMSINPALKDLVAEFTQLVPEDHGRVRDLAEQIVYRWARVEAVAADSRGEFFDGQKLAVLEKIFGEPFDVSTRSGKFISNDPTTALMGQRLTQSWDTLFEGILNNLMVQIDFGGAFDNVVYDIATDAPLLLGSLDDVITAVAIGAPIEPIEAIGYWRLMSPILDQLKSDSNINDVVFKQILNDILAAQGITFTYDQLSNAVISEGLDDRELTGTELEELFVGSGANEDFSGGQGGDVYLLNAINWGQDRVVEVTARTDESEDDVIVLPEGVTL
ncbi:MAG TPA: hypothetical protein DEO56_03205, partial [Nitrosomonas nitrosa]|nr:hypothetical protein [Nitrosomonas nitrosa]